MSRLVLVVIVMVIVMRSWVMMTRINGLGMGVDTPVLTVSMLIGNCGQMQVRKVVTVVTVMENGDTLGGAAGVKEDHRPAARSGEDRLPISGQSATSVHHRIIRVRSSIGLP
jgi:hypothetical protein